MIVFFILISFFIPCLAMEETKPFPFLKLPPDLQNLVLSFVDVHNTNINWESEATFRNVLYNSNPLYNTSPFDHQFSIQRRLPKKFNKFKLEGQVLYSDNGYKENIVYQYEDNKIPPLYACNDDLIAVSPDNSKIAALYPLTLKENALFTLDFKNKTFSRTIVSSLPSSVTQAFAISSDNNFIAYLTHNLINAESFISVHNRTTKEQKDFSEKKAYVVAYLEFNAQATCIGARFIKDYYDKGIRIITIHALDNDPRIKFLKRLCKDPEKQIKEAAHS